MDRLPEGDAPDIEVPEEEVWNLLTDKQKKYFKKITEKNEENLRYIG